MANRWCDGFGRYGGDTDKMRNGSSSQAWAEINGMSLSTDNPRTGTHCLRQTESTFSRLARRVFGTQLEEVYVGMAVYCHSLPTRESDGSYANGLFLAALRDQSNNTHLWFFLGTDGAIYVRRGYIFTGGEILGRTDPVIGAGAYQHIEIYARASTENGAVEIRVDEVTRLNLTGINTVTNSNVEFSQLVMGAQSDGATAQIDYADIFVNDVTDDGSGCNTFVGDCKSGVRMVDADTAQADFAKSAGSVGFSLLNETPPDDDTYIERADATGRSDFGLADAPANATEILTVRPFDRAWKDDAGTALLAPSMLSGSDTAVVTPQPIATAPSYYDSNVPFNPATGAPWTPAEFNAALRAVERTA